MDISGNTQKVREPMKSVFEKIIEKLEKLADELYKAYCIGFNSDDRAEYDAYINAIEIVKQEAEQYNNGWIPCNELLPAYGQTVLASVCAEDAEWKIIIACYKEEDFWLDGKIDAWQPLPEPYQPNGE